MDMNEKEMISKIKDIFEESQIEGKVILTKPVFCEVKDEYADISLLMIVYQNEISDSQIENIKKSYQDLGKETGKDITIEVVSLQGWENLIEGKSFYANMDNWETILCEYVVNSSGLDAALDDVKNGNLTHYKDIDEMIKDILNKPEVE